MGNKLIKKKKATSSNADYEWDEKTIRKRKNCFILGIVSALIAIILLVFCFILLSKGKQEFGLAVLVGWIITAILAVVLIYKNVAYVIHYEATKMYKKYENQELCEIALSDANSIKQKFLNYKFEAQADGLLFRKKFSPLKDFISYYVSVSEAKDIKKLLKRQLDHINTKKTGNSCLIIFAYMDEISEETKIFVKNHGMNMIVSEEVFETCTQTTVILVAVDKQRQKGWYVDIGKKKKLSLYSHGCRLIRKCLGSI